MLLVADGAIDRYCCMFYLWPTCRAHTRRFAPFDRELHTLLGRLYISKRAGRRGAFVADGFQVIIARNAQN